MESRAETSKEGSTTLAVVLLPYPQGPPLAVLPLQAGSLLARRSEEEAAQLLASTGTTAGT